MGSTTKDFKYKPALRCVMARIGLLQFFKFSMSVASNRQEQHSAIKYITATLNLPTTASGKIRVFRYSNIKLAKNPEILVNKKINIK
jgi:hypothetical protein